jgi:hypothetical protein
MNTPLSACNGVAPVTSAAAKTLRLGGELCLAGSNRRGREASGALNSEPDFRSFQNVPDFFGQFGRRVRLFEPGVGARPLARDRRLGVARREQDLDARPYDMGRSANSSPLILPGITISVKIASISGCLVSIASPVVPSPASMT